MDAKRFADLGNAALPQLVLAQLMESGEMERQLRLMITFNADFADTDFVDTDLAAASLERGVKVHPLSWHSRRPYRPGLVLGYAGSTATKISEGVAILGDVARSLR